ncbi:MAG: TIGR02391 family protein [Deltaproteobacteria bacterium]|nr:TIGR02391 family protein [Deltaproteobacteria bacterium]
MALRFKNRIPPFEPERLEAMARVLADTSDGLTGSEIGRALAQSKIPDVDSTNTKWKRLYNAFAEFQNEHQIGNHVVVFIKRAMDPARYTSDPRSFASRRDALNPILALCGMTLGEDGKVRNASKATTLDEALERANRFQTQLRQRDVHADVFRYCSAEILAQNYFHAVFEAMKSVTAKIRDLAGADTDGQRLVDDAFSFGKDGTPTVAINGLATATQRGEQKGFTSLLKGLYGTIRNPLAHDPKIDWDMSEQDALEIMGMISLVHRKLDGATRTSSARRST